MNLAFRRRVMAQGGDFTLSALPQGTLVGLNESGVIKPFIVAKHNYQSSGRTLLLRKWLHSSRKWHTALSNAYATSAIDTWLNGTYLSTLGADVKAQIAAVTIPYTIGGGNWTVSYISRKVFLLSGTEAGIAYANMNVEGTFLGLFQDNPSRIAYMESDTTTGLNWWTRSPRTAGNNHAVLIGTAGGTNYYDTNTAGYVRPAFTFSGDLLMNRTPNAQGYYLPL